MLSQEKMLKNIHRHICEIKENILTVERKRFVLVQNSYKLVASWRNH